MATPHVISREEFVVAAVERGDVGIAQQYFAQEEVVAEVERVNAFFRGRETPLRILDDEPEDPWYFTQPPGQYFRQVGPRALIFDTAMRNDNLALLQWFFAPVQTAFMGVTLAALFHFVGEAAAYLNHIAALEVLLTSGVFTTMLADDKRLACLHSMLHLAVEGDHEEAATILLAHGAQVNSPPGTDPDMLTVCASSGTARVRGVEMLVANGIVTVGADVLHGAAQSNNVESARELLQHGVDWGNKAGTFTPLHFAIEDRRPELVQLYLEDGFADVDTPDFDGVTPIELAARMVEEDGNESDSDSDDGHRQEQVELARLTVNTLRRYGATLP